jgi:hypothetical protein
MTKEFPKLKIVDFSKESPFDSLGFGGTSFISQISELKKAFFMKALTEKQ